MFEMPTLPTPEQLQQTRFYQQQVQQELQAKERIQGLQRQAFIATYAAVRTPVPGEDQKLILQQWQARQRNKIKKLGLAGADQTADPYSTLRPCVVVNCAFKTMQGVEAMRKHRADVHGVRLDGVRGKGAKEKSWEESLDLFSPLNTSSVRPAETEAEALAKQGGLMGPKTYDATGKKHKICGIDGCLFKTSTRKTLNRHRAAAHNVGPQALGPFDWHECVEIGCGFRSKNINEVKVRTSVAVECSARL